MAWLSGCARLFSDAGEQSPRLAKYTERSLHQIFEDVTTTLVRARVLDVSFSILQRERCRRILSSIFSVVHR